MGFIPVLFCLLATAAAVPLEVHGGFDERHLREPALQPPSHVEVTALTSKLLEPSNLVFGGKKATGALLPMQALIIYTLKSSKVNTLCGGTIISPNHVLTAAHCVLDMVLPAQVMVGSVNARKNTSYTQWRHIHKVYPHSGYKGETEGRANDIAVVEFSPAIRFSSEVKMVNIKKNDDQLIKNPKGGIVSGFGTYKFGGKHGNETIKSPDLLFAPVKVFNTSYCNSEKIWRGVLSKDQICAGDKGTGIGPGDSGGPLLVLEERTLYQVGLTSWATKFGKIMRDRQDLLPSVFTRVSHYCNIISGITRGVFKCK
ncbi:hypothetical protein QR680_014491 [Steinernema hermaphroditum]|uniref:Peptidase S1 domain-containing protein n=1 Tax=Steinernema hermaphroditum TaxID=289476 RepID=A0AA39IBM5_9BILA|nr:hypothetical protein QR680_014491 [Steinernema hermaphroditum]